MKYYLVGGAVRDKLLNLPFSERDYVVIGETKESMLKKGSRERSYKPGYGKHDRKVKQRLDAKERQTRRMQDFTKSYRKSMKMSSQKLRSWGSAYFFEPKLLEGVLDPGKMPRTQIDVSDLKIGVGGWRSLLN